MGKIKEKKYISDILSRTFLFYEVYKSNFIIKTKVVLEEFDPEGGAYGIGRTHGHRH